MDATDTDQQATQKSTDEPQTEIGTANTNPLPAIVQAPVARSMFSFNFRKWMLVFVVFFKG